MQAQKATVFAMDMIPRTLSRGQAYDALSSQVGRRTGGRRSGGRRAQHTRVVAQEGA